MTEHAPQEAPLYGVPLGGIGTGCFELGPGAFFRNLTLNNNRSAVERIPFAPASFFALRVAAADSLYSRVLQYRCEGSAFPGLSALPRLLPGEDTWHGVYPMAHYALQSEAGCPASVKWGAYAPIIPFDLDSSTLPVLFATVHCANHTQERMRVSALFNWQNLLGHTALVAPPHPATIRPVTLEEREEPWSTFSNESSAEEWPAKHNALLFELEDAGNPNASGQYCLAVQRMDRAEVYTGKWNPSSSEDCQAFWQAFEQEAPLPGNGLEPVRAEAGAVCIAFDLEPGETRHANFALAWYMPHYFIQGEDVGNHYTNRFLDAPDVVHRAWRNSLYYLQSVQLWHRRILQASLPQWMMVQLIAGLGVFSTNTLYTRAGNFTLLSSPGEPVAGRLDDRLYTSLGTLLFFSRFEENELVQYTAQAQDAEPRNLPATLTAFALAGAGEPISHATACGVHFILAAYRNYSFTGSVARLRALLPAMAATLHVLDALTSQDHPLPAPVAPIATREGIVLEGLDSPTAGLWVATLRAMEQVMRRLNRTDDADRFAQRSQEAAAAFEEQYWDEEGGYYWLGPRGNDAPATHALCHQGQLSGEWYASFLGMEPLFQAGRVQRALDTLATRNHLDSGWRVAVPTAGEDTLNETAWAWPAHALAFHACLALTVQKNLSSAESLCQHPQWPAGSVSGPPLRLPPCPQPGYPSFLERNAAALGAWHLLFAAEGIKISVPERRIRIAPSLHDAIGAFHWPLFLPSCLGTLDYEEVSAPEYRQSVNLLFDSPLLIETLEIRVPEHISSFRVQGAKDGNPPEADFTVEQREGHSFVCLRFTGPATGATRIDIEIAEAPEESAPEPEKGGAWLRRLFTRE